MQVWKSSCNLLQFIQIPLWNLGHDKKMQLVWVLMLRPLADLLSVGCDEWAGMGAVNPAQNLAWGLGAGEWCGCWSGYWLWKLNGVSHPLHLVCPYHINIAQCCWDLSQDCFHTKYSSHTSATTYMSTYMLNEDQGSSPSYHFTDFHLHIHFPVKPGMSAAPYRPLTDFVRNPSLS